MGATVRLDIDGDATDLQRAAGQAGDALDGLGKDIPGKTAAFAAAGAGLAVGLSAAFVSSLEFESAGALLEAQLGSGSPLAASAGEAAGKLYASAYGESLGEVNEAVKSVAQNISGMSTASVADLQSVTGQMMSMAQVMGVDVSEAARAVGQMIRTGLAKDATEAMDILTAASQRGTNRMGDLAATFDEYSIGFQASGISGATAAGMMTQAMEAGAMSTDQLGDAMTVFAENVRNTESGARDSWTAMGMDADAMYAAFAKGGPDAAAALDQTMDRLRQMPADSNRSALAVGLFGDKANEMQNSLFAIDPSAATAALGDFAGAAATADAALGDTAGAKLESVKRGFQEWTNSIVGVQGPLGTVAASVMTFGGDAIGIAGSIGMTAVALQGMGAGAKLAAAGQWLLNVAMSANPIMLVVIAIAALVGGLIWAYNNVGWFKDGVDAAFSFVKDVVGGAIDWVVDAWQVGWAWFESLPEQAGALIGGIGDWFASLPGLILDGLLALGSMVLTFWTETLPNGIAFALGYLAGMIYNGAVAAWDFLWNTLPNAIGQAVEWVGTLPGLALDALINLGVYLVQVATDAWAWFMEASTTGAQITLDWIAALPGVIGAWLASLPGIIGNAAVAAWEWFLNATTSGGQAALDWIAGVPGMIGNFFAGAGSWLVDAGKNILLGLWNGLKSIAQSVLDWISGIGASIAAGFNAAVGNHSPSVIFADSGRNMMRGVLVGYEDLGPNVIAEAAALGRQTTEAYTSSAMIRTEDGGSVPSSFYSQTSPAYQAKYGAPSSAARSTGGAQVTFTGNTDTAFAAAFMRLYREGKIQIKVGA